MVRESAMKIFQRFLSIVAALMALPFIYGGCVVIFSSSDHEDKYQDNQEQTLAPTPAVISAENAVEFAAGAIAGGPVSGKFEGQAADTNPGQNFENAFRTMRLPVALASALSRIETDPAAILFSRSDISEEIGSVAGSCGGQFDYTLDYNRVSETVSGRIEFINYCLDDIIISNLSEVDGYFDNRTGDIVSASFTFEDFTVDGLAYGGTLEIDVISGEIQAYLSIDTDGSAHGGVFTLSSYFVNVIQSPGFQEVWISGTYHHPEFGAVELDTTEPFVIHAEDRWPSSGLAVVTGQGDTSAVLTAVDLTRFRVAADTAGSGRFSRYLGMHLWAE